MPDLTHLLAFSAIALGMVLTPGPNMVYLVSRAICQGRVAGLIDSIGGAFGLVLGMTGASALLLLISMVSAISVVTA